MLRRYVLMSVCKKAVLVIKKKTKRLILSLTLNDLVRCMLTKYL